eukprot:scaffold36375_cov75-Phaeocystis_antarctica.AAC.1
MHSSHLDPECRARLLCQEASPAKCNDGCAPRCAHGREAARFFHGNAFTLVVLLAIKSERRGEQRLDGVELQRRRALDLVRSAHIL